MEALFFDLASREPAWELDTNPYLELKDDNSVVERFNKNWMSVFGTGYGLPPLERAIIKARYKDCREIDDISKEFKISKKEVNTMIENHIKSILSCRSYILLACEYPMQLSEMKQHKFEGFFDNYGRWHEPEFNAGNTSACIAAFDVFDNAYFNGIAKSNNITTIGKLVKWLDDNAADIRDHKAGIGKSTAKLLLNNAYVLHLCNKNTVSILCDYS